jgi:hypothetical protein
MQMPKQKIPCSECEARKAELEEAGDNVVIGCEPIEGDDGWCEIEWEEQWHE